MNAVFAVIILLEAALLVASYYVNRYAFVRAGLYRHFHYRRTQYEAAILGDLLRYIWVLAGLALLVLSVFFISRAIKKRSGGMVIGIFLMNAVMMGIAIVILLTDWREKLLLYPYLLLGILIASLFNLLIGWLVTKRGTIS